MTLWPAPLRRGDRVQLAAASSALQADALQRLEGGIAVLESWGLQVDPHPEPLRRWGHLAGTDHERLDDLQSEAPLVACLRGGWGAARLLEHPGLLRPSGAGQWLLGYSDVTSLLWARQAAGITGGIHGPMLTSLAAEPSWSQERLRQLLFGEPLPALAGTPWVSGVADGPLLVGNLTVATHLLGTAHLPELRGAVLVLEDIGEAPYRLDRMLTHWRLSGALQQLAGIGFGSFSDCSDTDDATDTWRAVLQERTSDLGIPVLADLPVGHEPGNAALALGQRVQLDATGGELVVLQA
ncbi:LD-carboxypeptidase [Synechococcus sp. CB0101]|jgi:muramoyltetrapeptide carboxypeptidase|uniref:S66 peptidase family protein n=1 Tax=Synechococcus sp. CB0101 TaxID=232348 RepID=UPI0002001D88|nr:LD-carboxypeptidase [Synechococcus sp. CB0101]QCH15746.1 LD-carboxypeptidase [Synechococcus sp. CB0101]